MVTLAAVTGAHGLHGEVRLKLFTDDLAAYREVRVGGRPLTIAVLRPDGTIVRFAEVRDRDEAERLRGMEVQVPRTALPPLAEGEYYHADLIDLPCLSSAGEPVGRVVTVENFGAGDVIEIERPDGTAFMVPMRPEAVPEWNADRLVVDSAYLP